MIFKPSEEIGPVNCSFGLLRFLLKQVLPDGVFNVVQGDLPSRADANGTP
ncbi:hypothetical protein [Photobacterium leiognathi]|nr:hypothetical protein [Photobacterium leiognathi]